mgnify:CR=1 FL=1
MIEPITKHFILIIDLGSSNIRVSFSPLRDPVNLISGASISYRYHRVGGQEGFGVGFNPGIFWERLVRVVHIGMKQAEIAPSSIAAFSIVSQRQAIGFISNSGSTVYLGPNTDLRAIFEGASIDESFGEEIYEATGHALSFLSAPAKLHWWRRHHPRISKRIDKILSLGSWLAFHLTGEKCDTASQMLESGLFSLNTSRPPDYLSAMGIHSELLPVVVPDGSTVGILNSRWITDLGIPKNIPVTLAGPDTQTALLGMNAIADGDTGIVSGWSTPVQRVTTSAILDSEKRTWTGRHVLQNQWVIESNAGDTGATLDMIRNTLGPKANLNRLENLLSKSRVGANYVTGFWGPHAINLSSPEVSMGGLLLATPIAYNPVHSGHIVRATVENIAYSIRQCVERLDNICTDRGGEIRLTGGLAQNRIFAQILSDVLWRPIRVYPPEGTSIGAAIQAAAPESDRESLARDLIGKIPLVEPDVQSAIQYKYLFDRWVRLQGILNNMWEEL